MAGIALEGVRKVYPNGFEAVRGVDLDIPDGEFVVLVGPSGCGKTTLLRTIAGLEAVSDGTIRIGDRDVTDVAPRGRDIAMVFQNYALYPHMRVRDNLAFGLRLRRTPRPEREARVAEASRTLALAELLDRKPGALSGGQRQRVAMGRAMVREPQAFLMDEPLSNLDAKLRVTMRAELARLHARLGTTTVYVTHDQVEAMTLGHRVAVMRDGVIQQCAPPQDLYDRPVNVFVAAFMGSPQMNIAGARLDGDAVEFAGQRLPLPAGSAWAGQRRDVLLGIRPSDLVDARDADPGAPRLLVVVDVVERLGSETHLVFGVDAPTVSVEQVGEESADEEGRLLADDRARFTARVYGARRYAPDERVELALDLAGAHLFDPATGASLGPGTGRAG